MKKIIFALLLFNVSHLSFSQLITEEWNMTRYDESFSPEHPHPTWDYYGLKIYQDTLIDNISYRKLFLSTDTLCSDVSFLGGIREDSGRIYLGNSYYHTKEVLLYDFNLDNGDTLTIHRIININAPTITSVKAKIDSVNRINIGGHIKKRLYIEYECDQSEHTEKDIWIEGIGSIKNGFLNESCNCLTGCYSKTYLTCYFEDNTLVWRDSTFDNCYIDSTQVSNRINGFEEQVKQINVSRIGENIKIYSDIPVLSVKAMDISGHYLYEKNNLDTFHYEFSLRGHTSGLIIIIINNRYSYKVF